MRLPPFHPLVHLVFGVLMVLGGVYMWFFGAAMTTVVVERLHSGDVPDSVRTGVNNIGYMWNLLTMALLILIKMDVAPSFKGIWQQRYGEVSDEELELRIDDIMIKILVGIVVLNFLTTLIGAAFVGYHIVVAFILAMMEVPSTEILINVGVWAIVDALSKAQGTKSAAFATAAR